MRIVRLFSALLLTGGAAVAGVDPTPPPGGFTIQVDLNLTYTWSDGYNVLMDVRYPVDPPGPCGWPLVVLVHGGGGSKQVVAAAASELARSGYLTLAYDVRGQGSSVLANPPALWHDFVGLRELIDLFEAMEAAEALYPALVDSERVGVTGYSQGGGHSWWAAQHSGRLPPPNPWRAAAFPVVSAVVVKDSAGGRAGDPEWFQAATVDKMFGPPSIRTEPGIQALLQGLILAEDFAGFYAAVDVPGMDPTTLLPLTTVPVYAHASYDDKRVNPSGVFGSFSLLPATTPKRLQLGTSGHDSPQNDQDGAIYQRNRQRWFDRFLKSIANSVDSEPSVHAAVTPEDPADYVDPSTLWDFRDHAVLPDPTTVTTRSYLTPAGALAPVAPGAAAVSPLVHSVPAALTMASYSAGLPNAAQVEALVGLSQVTYDSPPMAQDVHMEGIATISLSTATANPNYQIHAVLFDVAPNGQARFVTRGGVARLGAAGPGTVTITPYLQSYVFRQGHRVRLSIENLAIHRPPTGSAPYLKVVPYFQSSVVNILEGGPMPSFIDLPTLPFTAPTLSTYPLEQDVSAPSNQRLKIHSNTHHAGGLYLLLPTLSGTSPGTPIAGVTVPINFDPLTWALIGNPGLPPFLSFLGVLDPIGSADAGVLFGGLALPAGLAGLDLSMAAIVASGSNRATNAVTVPFVP